MTYTNKHCKECDKELTFNELVVFGDICADCEHKDLMEYMKFERLDSEKIGKAIGYLILVCCFICAMIGFIVLDTYEADQNEDLTKGEYHGTR